MPKMTLPVKTGDETPEEDSSGRWEHRREPATGSARRVDPGRLDKEAVFEWFGLHLSPAKRIELLCGLMHMCQPLELRFLGSYLEDLARKDYHVLRDFDLRANSPQELALLTDVVDPVARAKLLVCVSLLGSDSRECAGVLFGILSRVDPALFRKTPHSAHPACPGGNVCRGTEPTCGFAASGAPAGPLNQFALLFTMASLHPAFLFHQREALRQRLDQMETAVEEGGRRFDMKAKAAELTGQKGQYLPSSPLTLGECADSHPPCQSRRSRRQAIKREAVHIEGIVLKCISRTRVDKEYTFEVKWSDSSFSNVTKTHLELENFLFKLPKHQCTETFEKGLLRLLSQGDHYESREVEENLREKFLAAPSVFRQTRKVCSFFNCDSSYSTKFSCCRCNSQLGKNFQGDCSDASSQDEAIKSYSQGHKKKHGTKSTSQCLSCAKGLQGESRRGTHATELSGPAERRKRGCTMKSMPESVQDTQKRSYPGTNTKNRVLPPDRNIAKGSRVINGLVAVGGSGLDTFGETSSESYSSPSSPHHRGAESLESEDDYNKDTDSHSDDSCKIPGPDVFFTQQTDPSVVEKVMSVRPIPPNNHTALMDFPGPENNMQFPRLSLMHRLPYVLPNGACDPPHVPPPSSVLPDGKPPSGPMVMQMPPVVPVLSGPVETEKRDIIPTFGLPSVGFQLLGGTGVQPVVQRFKTSLPHSQSGHDGMSGTTSTPVSSQPAQQAPVRGTMSVTSYPTSTPTSLPCQDAATITPPSLPLGETTQTKNPALILPSALPSPYTVPPGGAPATTGTVSSPVQAAVPPAVPTHAPVPGPNPSPALLHSAPHSDCLSFSNTSTSCGSAPSNPLAFQQSHHQVPSLQPAPVPSPQQQQMGCGTCGCHINCGGRGSSNSVSICQGPLFYPNHQMVAAAAAAARQVVPPPLFQLTSLCINSYLTQGQQPPHQANGGTSLPTYYPTAPPPGHPSAYGPLHSHSHSHADVPSHMLSTQVVAAASYNLQQQMTPAASFFHRVYQQVYPNPLGMLPTAALGGGGVNKKNGSMSCCNCGMTGHYAQDCNQPSIDSSQQGSFRLRYSAAHVSEALDSAY